MRRRNFILAIPVLLAARSSAQAHALLRGADPAVGSSVPAAPAEVKLLFSEAVEPAFCRVEVTDAQGGRVDTGQLHVDPNEAKRLVVELAKLGAGTFTVTWHVTSTDTHKTQGSFTFTVTAP